MNLILEKYAGLIIRSLESRLNCLIMEWTSTYIIVIKSRDMQNINYLF